MGRLTKRLIDIVFSATVLALCAPLLLGAAMLIRLQMGKPTLFRQVRPGLCARPFTIYKFRTMLDAFDRDGRPLSDEQRLTGLGRWLRRFSIDELPQFINVLRGDMSVVGPRPLLMEYLPLYTSRQARRHEVRPGITGWAQINGRNAITWDQKFEYDIWYVDHWSFWLDVTILAMTIWKVLRRADISQSGCATMPHYTGSPAPDRAEET